MIDTIEGNLKLVLIEKPRIWEIFRNTLWGELWGKDSLTTVYIDIYKYIYNILTLYNIYSINNVPIPKTPSISLSLFLKKPDFSIWLLFSHFEGFETLFFDNSENPREILAKGLQKHTNAEIRGKIMIFTSFSEVKNSQFWSRKRHFDFCGILAREALKLQQKIDLIEKWSLLNFVIFSSEGDLP